MRDVRILVVDLSEERTQEYISEKWGEIEEVRTVSAGGPFILEIREATDHDFISFSNPVTAGANAVIELSGQKEV